MDLEETLARVVELSREELHIVRKRAEEKTPARDHGHDFDEMKRAADRLDHYAHLLRMFVRTLPGPFPPNSTPSTSPRCCAPASSASAACA
jgi:hypothetical protein